MGFPLSDTIGDTWQFGYERACLTRYASIYLYGYTQVKEDARLRFDLMEYRTAKATEGAMMQRLLLVLIGTTYTKL